MTLQVNRIMSRMDTVVAKLKSRETKLTENLDKIVEKSEAHEDDNVVKKGNYLYKNVPLFRGLN